MISSIFIGMAVASGIIALIPSNAERSMEVPWGSILLALISGACVALAGLAAPLS